MRLGSSPEAMSMKRWYYTYAGLRVVSELRIPEWSVFEEPQPFDEAEVFFTLKDTPDGQSELRG